MDKFSPYTLANQKRLHVATFLRECTIQTPFEDRPAYSVALVPIRYLTWLYNAWVDARGIDPMVKLTQARMTYLLNRIDPEEDQIQKVKKSVHTRSAIICVDLELNPSPIVSPQETLEAIGATIFDPFVIPGQHETPASLLNEILALQPALKRSASLALDARRRFSELTEDEKAPPTALLSKHLAGALDASEETNPEPQEKEQDREAIDAVDPNLESFN